MGKDVATIDKESHETKGRAKLSKIQKKITYRRTKGERERYLACALRYGGAVCKKTTTYFKKPTGGQKKVCKVCKQCEIVYNLTEEEEEEVQRKWAVISDEPFCELGLTIVTAIGIDETAGRITRNRKTRRPIRMEEYQVDKKVRNKELKIGVAETNARETEAQEAETNGQQPESRNNDNQMVEERWNEEELKLIEELAELEHYKENGNKVMEWEGLESIEEMLEEAVKKFEENEDHAAGTTRHQDTRISLKLLCRLKRWSKKEYTSK